MLTQAELRSIARERLVDARTLLGARRYDGCAYLAGYVVEIALKARICQTLKWSGFPETNREWERARALKTHDLDTLLLFTGVEAKIRARLGPEWATLQDWNPEQRYDLPGRTTRQDAENMIDAASKILKSL